METQGSSVSDGEVEDRILDMLRSREQLTFLELADSMSEYRWRILLAALRNLQERRLLTLRCSPDKYEVILRKASPR